MHITFTSAVPSAGVTARPLLSVSGTVQQERLKLFLLTAQVSPETESSLKVCCNDDVLHVFCFKDATATATHMF